MKPSPKPSPAQPFPHRLLAALAAAGVVLMLFALVGFGLPVEPAGPSTSATSAPSGVSRPSGSAGPALHGRAVTYPEARRTDHVDRLHGREVADPYRWMEDMSSPETRAWAKAEDDLARDVLHGLPGFEALEKRLEEVNRFDSLAAPVPRGERLFFTRRTPDQRHSVLYVQDDPDAEPRVLVDANRQENLALVSFVPGPEGRRVAYQLSPVGSGWGPWRIREVATGRDLPDRLEGIRIGGPVWSADGREVFYAAYQAPEKGRELETVLGLPRIYRHRVGGNGPDPVIFDRPEQPGWLYSLATTEDGRWLVILAAEGSAGENRVLLLDLTSDAPGIPPVRALAPRAEASYRYLGSRGSWLYLATDLDAPRNRVLGLDLTAWENGRDPEWVELIPESSEMLSAVSLVADHFIGLYLKDAVPEVRVFDLEGKPRHRLRLPQLGTTFSGFLGRRTDPAAYLTVNSVALPSTPYRLDPAAGTIELVARPRSAFDPRDYVLDQVFYRGKDGTRIPMFLAYRKGLDPRDRPLMMYGYGAYGWPAFPWFQPSVVVWMERGGLYALPGIRGGGEYGDTWHEAGTGRHKQTSIDDFLAAAEFLVEQGYTSPEKLVVRGGSASGVLAAAALVQRPELFKAALINIPVLDLIRGHVLTSGGYRFAEFGTPEDPEDLEALLGYSPVHNLEPGVCRPATLVVAGEKDEVAPPVHAYKFTAAFQHAQSQAPDCTSPVLLRMAWGAGHSIAATPDRSPEMWASQLAFLGWRTGLAMTGNAGASPEVTGPIHP